MSAQAAGVRGNDVLEFKDTEFRQNFPNQGFKIGHRLCDEAAFQLPRLVELAKRLPENLVEYYSGGVSVGQRNKGYPKTGLSVVETVRRIEESGSWMVMKNVEVDAEYNGFLRTLLDEWYREIDPRQRELLRGDCHREHAFLFISSPNSVTPYHLDDEHNFLLQIRGTKQVSMWDPSDREVVSEPEMESQLEFFHDANYERYLPYQEAFQTRARVFELNPGEGLHFPFGAPHWVKNGSQVSISFSITFRSGLSERLAKIYFVNKRLRRIGLTPTPPARSQWRDSLKSGAFQAARRTGKLLRGSFANPD
jgi:hypothetical protein